MRERKPPPHVYSQNGTRHRPLCVVSGCQPDRFRWSRQQCVLHQSIRRARIFAIDGGDRRAFGVRFRSDRTVASVRHRRRSAAQGRPLQPGESLRRLSIDEAVKLALEQNLGIQIQRFNPQIQDIGDRAGAIVLGAAVQLDASRRPRNEQPVVNIFSGHAAERHDRPVLQRPDADRDAAVGRELHGELEQLAVHDDDPIQHVQPAAPVEPVAAISRSRCSATSDRSDPAAGRQQQEVPRLVGHPARYGHRPDDAQREERVLGSLVPRSTT